MFVAKTAIPIPSRNSLQDALFSQAANSPLTLFACPPGYIAKEALADSLTRQGFSIMWLRLESEDRDPATLLLSIIESARQLQPEAGERTLERMKFNPGPIFGWPQLFVQLSDDLSECLPATTAIVLDRVERLNVMPPLLELLSKSFLGSFTTRMPRILIAHEPLPSVSLPNNGVTRLAKDFRLKKSEGLHLLEDSNTAVSIQSGHQLIDMIDGRLVTLLGIVKACDQLGPGLIEEFISNSKNADQLLFQIARACMMTTDLAGLQALALALRLEYWHPVLSQALIGEDINPPGPWVQFLTDGWSRITCNWYRSLYDVVRLSPGELQAGLHRAADYLVDHGGVERAVSLYLEARDFQAAAGVLAGSVEKMINRGQWGTIQEWLIQFPPAVLTDWPSLIYVQGEIATSKGQIKQARQYFTRSANLYRRRHEESGACQSLLAESTLADWEGDRERAMVCALSANQLAVASGNFWLQGMANWQLGCLTFISGNLDYSSAYFSRAAQVTTDLNLNGLFLQAYQLTQRQRDLIRQAEYFRQTCAVLEQSERSTADKLSVLIGSPPDNLASFLNGHGWLQMPLFLKLAPMPFEVPQDNHRFLRGLINFFDALRVVRRSSKSGPLEITPINDYPEPINLSMPESLLDSFENGHLDNGSNQEIMTPVPTRSNGTQIPFWPEEDQGIPNLVIYCLGPFRVYQNNRYIPDWPSKKAQLVFKYLLTQRHRRASKEVLMETFWPDVEPEAARRSLHQAIYSLRRSLGIINSQYQYVLFENDAYFLDPEMKIWIDYEEFEHRCRSGDLLLESGDLINAMKEYEIAENLYQDHYLSDDLYEDWVEPYRQYLWQMYLRISLSLARSHLERKEYSQAVGISQRILGRDMAQEEAHQIIIRSYLLGNQRHLAMRQYHLCVQVFKNEFNLLPSPETRALIQNLVSE